LRYDFSKTGHMAVAWFGEKSLDVVGCVGIYFGGKNGADWSTSVMNISLIIDPFWFKFTQNELQCM
jgi:hypothetical protein